MRPGVLAMSLALAFALSAPRPALAVVIDRVVAVVGKEIVTLFELRERARPTLARMRKSIADPAQRSAAEVEVHRETLKRIVDEMFIARAAADAKVHVSSEEIDGALQMVASNAKLTVAELLKEARAQELSEPEYRDELRRQIFEGKMIELHVRPRVRLPQGATEQEKIDVITKERDKWLEGLRTGTYVDVRL